MGRPPGGRLARPMGSIPPFGVAPHLGGVRYLHLLRAGHPLPFSPRNRVFSVGYRLSALTVVGGRAVGGAPPAPVWTGAAGGIDGHRLYGPDPAAWPAALSVAHLLRQHHTGFRERLVFARPGRRQHPDNHRPVVSDRDRTGSVGRVRALW